VRDWPLPNQRCSLGKSTNETEKEEKEEAGEHGEEEESAEQQAKLASQPKITKEQASRDSPQRASGNVRNGELEREHGKLVYSL